MRYRLTKKGKRAVALLSFLTLVLLTLLVFAISQAVGAAFGPDMSPSPAGPSETPPSPTEISAEPTPTDPAPENTPESADNPTPPPSDPPPEPTDTSAPEPTPMLYTPAPAQSQTPGPIDNVYGRRLPVFFPMGLAAAADETALLEQLRAALSAAPDTYRPPELTQHYLIVEGHAAPDEEEALALRRAEYVRDLLQRELGFQTGLVTLSAPAAEGEDASSVLLYFLPMGGK